MRLRSLLGLAIPLACAALFIRLGVWQLSRHAERAEINAGLVERLAAPPAPFASLSGDSTAIRWQRVTLEGRFRYDLEQVEAGRGNGGSPGVHLLTPLQRHGNDTLVMVTRGWVYSPDASSVDHGRWREGDSVALSGFVLPLPDRGGVLPSDPRTPLRVLDRGVIGARLGVPLASLMVVMTSDSAARADSVPRRLALPAVETGPHRSYALQWFAFAIIALVGGVALYRNDGRKSSIVAVRAKG